MSIFNVLFDVIAPVAVIVALGASFGRRLKVDMATISRLAYWVFGPAFAFALLADADLERSVVWRIVLAAVAGMAAALMTAAAWARASGVGYEIGAAAVMTSVHGNVGNTGLAIVVFALGEQALPVAALLMVVINMVGLSLGVGLAHAQDSSPMAAALRGLTAPMTMASVVAVAVNVLNIDVPLVADRSIGLLGEALIPLMLFGLGIQLVDAGRPTWTNDLGATFVAKLAVAPLVAGLVGAALGLTGDPLSALVIQSAMPPAVFCAVVAMEGNLVPDRVTASVVATTLMSLLTLPVVLLLL